jgi:hypothetical protein
LQALQVTQSFSQSSKLSEFVPDSSAMTVSGDFSLILELTKKGWNFEYATPSKKTPAYAPEGAKTWFFHRQNKKGGINTAYLNALCQADSLFGAGLTKIFHFQLKIYYQAIVALPAANILPWQPRSYYQLLLQKHKDSKSKDGKRKKRSTPFDGDLGLASVPTVCVRSFGPNLTLHFTAC